MQQAIMDRVFIEPDKKEQGAIIMAEDEKPTTKTGIVKSVGERVKSVKVGDHVVFYDWQTLPAMDGLVAATEKYLLGVIVDD
jgi:co-chaperonin GroES (HSP10)